MDRPPSPSGIAPRRLLVGGTLLALGVALAASWAFVLRPAASRDDAIGVDDLVGADVAAPTGPVIAGEGKPAPDVTLTTFEGGAITTASLRGKVTVLNFWASTCTPCVKEMPMLEQAHQDLGDDVAFIGVDVFEAPDLGRTMIERTGVTYPQTVDPTNEVLGSFGGTQLPHTVVIDASGKVTAMRNRALADRAELDALIATAR